MALTGTVKAFGAKGFGFVTQADGSDIFLHIKDCVGSKPVIGDVVKYDAEPSATRPGTMQAKNVTGGSAPLDDFSGKIDGTGAYTGTVKALGAKGFGFLTQSDGTDIFMHVKDCVGSMVEVGDTVKFDIGPSDTKEGEMQARNITGGSAPLEAAMLGGGSGKGKGKDKGKGMMGGLAAGSVFGFWGPMKGKGMKGWGGMGGPYDGGKGKGKDKGKGKGGKGGWGKGDWGWGW
eukprot:TRINITY_DN6219_c1_g3_i1.p1 TRINITY_DN6219_c1_g3~~TRINITY_DN6219_c1_g3_i1.p1  ORF type:complete len:266 (-),score=70.59 TRINITY_DN6219_c1_g3_i1:205-900(-)